MKKILGFIFGLVIIISTGVIYYTANAATGTLTASSITYNSAFLKLSGADPAQNVTFYIFNDPNTNSPSFQKSMDLITDDFGIASAIFSLPSNASFIATTSDQASATYIHFTTPPDVNIQAVNPPAVNNPPVVNNPPAVTTPTSSTPTSAPAQNTGIVPKCGQITTTTDAKGNEISTMAAPCNFTDFMKLLNNIIKFLLFTIATPLIALIVMYTGYLYITAGGNSGQSEKVRHILFNAVIGYVIALAAWLVINTIISSLKVDPKIDTFMDKSTTVQ